MTPDTIDALQAEADRLGYHLTHTKEFIRGLEYVCFIRPDKSVAFRVTAHMKPYAGYQRSTGE